MHNNIYLELTSFEINSEDFLNIQKAALELVILAREVLDRGARSHRQVARPRFQALQLHLQLSQHHRPVIEALPTRRTVRNIPSRASVAPVAVIPRNTLLADTGARRLVALRAYRPIQCTLTPPALNCRVAPVVVLAASTGAATPRLQATALAAEDVTGPVGVHSADQIAVTGAAASSAVQAVVVGVAEVTLLADHAGQTLALAGGLVAVGRRVVNGAVRVAVAGLAVVVEGVAVVARQAVLAVVTGGVEATVEALACGRVAGLGVVVALAGLAGAATLGGVAVVVGSALVAS